MILKDKLSTPVVKLFKSDNLEFSLSFFYHVFRNSDKQVDTIRQTKIEKELKSFIKHYNWEAEEDRNEENAKYYLETWIKSKFLRRLQINEFQDDYDIELSETTLQSLIYING